MPGINNTFFVLAFNKNEHGEAVPVSKPIEAMSGADAIAMVQSLSEEYDGVVAWKLRAEPAVGELGVPEVLVSRGHVGDFA